MEVYSLLKQNVLFFSHVFCQNFVSYLSLINWLKSSIVLFVVVAALLHMTPPKYDKILEYSTRALEMSVDNVKALFRQGLALYHLHDYESAMYSLQKAHRLSSQPGNINHIVY